MPTAPGQPLETRGGNLGVLGSWWSMTGTHRFYGWNLRGFHPLKKGKSSEPNHQHDFRFDSFIFLGGCSCSPGFLPDSFFWEKLLPEFFLGPQQKHGNCIMDIPQMMFPKRLVFLGETFHLGSDVQIRLDGFENNRYGMDACFEGMWRSDEPLCVFWSRPIFFRERKISGTEFGFGIVHFKNSCVIGKSPPFCYENFRLLFERHMAAMVNPKPLVNPLGVRARRFNKTRPWPKYWWCRP